MRFEESRGAVPAESRGLKRSLLFQDLSAGIFGRSLSLHHGPQELAHYDAHVQLMVKYEDAVA